MSAAANRPSKQLFIKNTASLSNRKMDDRGRRLPGAEGWRGKPSGNAKV